MVGGLKVPCFFHISYLKPLSSLSMIDNIISRCLLASITVSIVVLLVKLSFFVPFTLRLFLLDHLSCSSVLWFLLLSGKNNITYNLFNFLLWSASLNLSEAKPTPFDGSVLIMGLCHGLFSVVCGGVCCPLVSVGISPL